MGEKYFRINTINNKGISKASRIDRLVRLNFLPNSKNKPTVNHKNHNSLDNNVNNLKWISTTEQNVHRRKKKKYKNSLLL